MKKIILIVALAVALTLAFAATASATSAKTWNYQEDYYSWGSTAGSGLSVVASETLGQGGSASEASGFANDNAANPGVHANYTTTTAKCGICHSVHRAKSGGVKLLNTSTATCAGCHISGTSTVTDVVIAWGTDAAPLAGPHHSVDSFDGTDTDGSCNDRACHALSPHGAGGSSYALFRSKLLTDAVDAVVADALADSANSGIDAAFLAGSTGTPDERAAVRAGYTCNSAGCHEQTMLPVIKSGWSEERVTIYPLTATILKTGHITGSAATSETLSAYAPVAGCVSCHEQEDATTRSGYTFPHAQRPTGAGAGTQNYLWMSIAGQVGDPLIEMTNSNMKSFDGACLKCHRDGADGIGLTH